MAVPTASTAARKINEVAIAYRHYNQIELGVPENRALREDVYNALSVRRKVQVRDGYRKSIEFLNEQCFQTLKDERGRDRLKTGYGFITTLEQIYKKHGVLLEVSNTRQMSIRDMQRMVPDVQLLGELDCRENQKAILDDMLHNEHGQYLAATGSGKSWVIRHYCRVYPRANILITTFGQNVLMDLYNEALKSGIRAGIYCSALKQPEGRVLFCSLGTLPRFYDRVWDALLLDEKHEAATLDKMQKLINVRTHRAYALSANHKDRLDGADGWLDSMFGECRVKASHRDAVDDGDIVPVEVHWRKLPTARPLHRIKGGTHAFDVHAYWRHRERNLDAAEFAKEKIANGEQVLIYVKFIEHAYMLWRLLKCPVAHAFQTNQEWKEKVESGVVPEELLNSAPSKKELRQLQDDFAAKKHLVAICNSVWKRGVNFPHLRYLVRLDGATNPIDATQVTGRVNRKGPGKTKGIIVDYVDAYHPDAERRSFDRKREYKKIGYPQYGW